MASMNETQDATIDPTEVMKRAREIYDKHISADEMKALVDAASRASTSGLAEIMQAMFVNGAIAAITDGKSFDWTAKAA